MAKENLDHRHCRLGGDRDNKFKWSLTSWCDGHIHRCNKKYFLLFLCHDNVCTWCVVGVGAELCCVFIKVAFI